MNAPLRVENVGGASTWSASSGKESITHAFSLTTERRLR